MYSLQSNDGYLWNERSHSQEKVYIRDFLAEDFTSNNLDNGECDAQIDDDVDLQQLE